MKLVNVDEVSNIFYGIRSTARYIQAVFPLEGIICEVEEMVFEDGEKTASGEFYSTPKELLVELFDIITRGDLPTSVLEDVLMAVSLGDLSPVDELKDILEGKEDEVESLKMVIAEIIKTRKREDVIIVEGKDIVDLLPYGNDIKLFLLESNEIRKVSKEVNVKELRNILGMDVEDVMDIINLIRVREDV
ncbi:hypothetical protein PFDSM3638_09970 [Pyrococcus furiosus DSM 3638]|uniref:Uncharacterized protein n=3 Tax=Pyrococcus furiosus TaxID=2261 RepID=Q8TZL0_PYRFU|nr:hypothetical protein [Pyrococcus furiosus]AAL82104.1 hypothetical protein PF1980 [Pyrococcus furiosus DSM 3638]AFN04661.1 hypothetical protein PFC_08680 [Pyrococcus furiosus COM1]QEK79575.1 hypothetical protein PFDSM3638_09970 [Pyrococcus furiosus DSM 3638]